MGIGSFHPRFFFIIVYLFYFRIFSARMDWEFHNVSFETSFVKIQHIYWQTKKNKEKCDIEKSILHHFQNFHKKIVFLIQEGPWSNKLSFEGLFVKICLEFSEIFDFWSYLRSGCHKDWKNIEGLIKCFEYHKWVHQDLLNEISMDPVRFNSSWS